MTAKGPSRFCSGAPTSQHNQSRTPERVRTSGGWHEDLVDVTQAAEYAGVSKDTIYTARERREMRHARISGRRSIRVKPEWIDE